MTKRANITERPTQKTIARLTGLAVPTVSRALAGAPDIGEETKKRVQEVAAEIGYRPDRAGVRLRTGKTNVISLVMSTDHDMMNHTARLLTSIAATLYDTPYHLNVTPYFATQDPMDPIRYIVETGSADGIILNQTRPEDPRIKYLLKQGFPFATHGRTNWCDQHPYFDFDNWAYGQLTVEAFAKKGRKHVLLVHPRLEQFYAREVFEASKATCENLGLRFEPANDYTSDDPSDLIYEETRRKLQKIPDIDAIICIESLSAMACASAAESIGKKIGVDIDLVGKEAIPFLKRYRPEIMTVNENVGRAGNQLALAVMERIANPTAKPIQGLEIPTEVS